MDIFVYLPSDLPLSREALEEEIETAIGAYGNVTGAGSGPSGSNIDIEIHEPQHFELGQKAILELLRKMKLPKGTYLMANGKKQPI